MSSNAGYMEEFASNVPLYKMSLMVDIVSSVTGILAALLILPILGKITAKQNNRISAEIFT